MRLNAQQPISAGAAFSAETGTTATIARLLVILLATHFLLNPTTFHQLPKTTYSVLNRLFIANTQLNHNGSYFFQSENIVYPNGTPAQSPFTKIVKIAGKRSIYLRLPPKVQPIKSYFSRIVQATAKLVKKLPLAPILLSVEGSQFSV